VAIDQGGCVATSRPTTHDKPTYLVDDIVHYAVTNMPGIVAWSSTHALTAVTLPYIHAITQKGLDAACASDPALAKGINIDRGECLLPELLAV
ncbi:MAG: alanine dehydrogenase, partial [Phycisphaeraceae bacterium]|nr:alanine dehydrogenase [Phycisphaeraceae bacterium]